MLSKLERDTANAAVASLLRVCDALGLRPGTLFDPPRWRTLLAGTLENTIGAGVHRRHAHLPAARAASLAQSV
ncbi:hypothetical protein [Fodinicola acaciae]|uniref:hypothetical protein n=1 Tax=Fodinicola acaciae TaxID=2681555 RepID=UPI0013D74EEC|nr:hypothetical protein [Fodinicola acaciae]